MQKTKSFKLFFAMFALSAIAYLLYVPGLAGPFLFDDFPNLEPLGYQGGVTDVESALRFIFGNQSGPTGRPVSMASFLLSDNAWPSNPFLFKKFNLLLHIACGLAAFLVIFQLLAAQEKSSERINFPLWFSFTVIAFWMLHPINVSTVLYPVQRMAILSAFFTLLSLYSYLLFRNALLVSESRAMPWFAAFSGLFFFALGILSKENAFLLIPFILLLELFYFEIPTYPRVIESLRHRLVYLSFFVFLLIAASSEWWASGYQQRGFTVYERLKYEFSVVGDYVLKIIFPVASDFNLFAGEYEAIGGTPFALSDYVKSAISVFLIALLVYSISKRHRVIVLGLLWFFTFHLLESTFYPLEIYFEHRNYLPAFGLLIAVLSIIELVLRKISTDKILGTSAFLIFLLYFAGVLFALSATWAKPDTLFLKWEMDEPQSARAKVVYASVVEQMTFPENSIEHIDNALQLRENAIGLHLRKIRLICEYGLNWSLTEAHDHLLDADRFEMGVVSALKDLMALDTNSDGYICENADKLIELSKIFSHIESLGYDKWNPTRAARYFSLKSDYYARKADLNSSVTALDNAIGFTPTVDLYLKKSVMLASAGLNQAALNSLHLARIADEDRPLFLPSRNDEMAFLEARILGREQSDLKQEVMANDQ